MFVYGPVKLYVCRVVACRLVLKPAPTSYLGLELQLWVQGGFV